MKILGKKDKYSIRPNVSLFIINLILSGALANIGIVPNLNKIYKFAITLTTNIIPKTIRKKFSSIFIFLSSSIIFLFNFILTKL